MNKKVILEEIGPLKCHSRTEKMKQKIQLHLSFCQIIFRVAYHSLSESLELESELELELESDTRESSLSLTSIMVELLCTGAS